MLRIESYIAEAEDLLRENGWEYPVAWLILYFSLYGSVISWALEEDYPHAAKEALDLYHEISGIMDADMRMLEE